MLAQQFVDKLENSGLLHPDIISELRRQLADSKGRVTVEQLAKLLVDNGHLTKFQATKLIAEFRESTPDPVTTRNVATAPTPPKPASPPSPASPPNNDLDLAPLDTAAGGSKPKTVSNANPSEEVEALEIVEDVVEADEAVEAVEVIEEAVEIVEPVEVVEKRRSKKSKAAPVTPAPEAFAPALTDTYTPAPRPKLNTKKAGRNPWEDFRILGVGSGLVLLLVVGGGLLWWYFRGTADETIKRADEAYEGRSYETADKIYGEFVNRFTSDDRLSYAKVRQALSKLRRVAETVNDPDQALKVAQEVLPPITEEPGLQSERSDLTGVLLTIAEKYNKRADDTKETAGKKTLMGSQGELQKILDNPQFVGAAQRTQQANRIARIEEEKQRILRDIGRDEDLVATLAKMKEALEKKDTVGSYGLRSELIRKYPQLEVDAELSNLVVQAANIQKELVEKSNMMASRSEDNSTPPAAVLVNPQGSPIDQLQGNLVYVNALGAVYGLDAATGNLLWRRYVGRNITNQPIRLTDAPDSDTLVTRASEGILERIGGPDGKSVWKSKMPEPILSPVVDNEQIFAATSTGQIAMLDGTTGDIRWSAKIPQPLVVGPGVGKNKPQLYLPGNHSNLYVLSRNSGECKEVLYLGHAAGSIAVPPLYMLGHLFVFENPAPDYSTVRIYATNDEGLELKPAQSPFRLKGNIVVPPQIDGRRVIVITDLGEIAVLDVELASNKEKVGKIAGIPASEPSPRQLFAMVRSNEMWICSNRFSRYDIQVSRGQIDRKWIKEDGDSFVGSPQQFGDSIIHARAVRGSQGIRVAAVRGSDGEEIWKTDIGVPVASLSPSGDQVYAVSSEAALFQLSGDNLNGSPTPARPAENPGLHDRSLLFLDPVVIDQEHRVLFNRSTANQVAFLDQSKAEKKLALVLLNLSGSDPSGTAVAAGAGLLVPLRNGQLVYADPATGRALASPFQPPLEAGDKVTWVEPAIAADAKSFVIANSKQKLYRINIGNSLEAALEADLEQPLRGRLVPVGTWTVGVSGGAVSDTLRLIETDTLKISKSTPLQGKVTWGPYLVDQRIWLHTDTDGLCCFDESLTLLWQVPLNGTALVDAPIMTSTGVLILAREGRIWKIEPAAGKLMGTISAGEPITGTSLLQDSSLLLGGEEGVVLRVDTNAVVNDEATTPVKEQP